MTSGTIQSNETGQLPFIGQLRIQKLSFFFNRVMPSDLRYLDDVVGEVVRATDNAALWGDVEGIGIAVREALANAIIHGNRDDPEKEVDIAVAANDTCDLIIIVRDSGAGFDPNRISNPPIADNLLASQGRGLSLIRQLMDRVDFRFKQGTEIVMQRRRQWLQ